MFNDSSNIDLSNNNKRIEEIEKMKNLMLQFPYATPSFFANILKRNSDEIEIKMEDTVIFYLKENNKRRISYGEILKELKVHSSIIDSLISKGALEVNDEINNYVNDSEISEKDNQKKNKIRAMQIDLNNLKKELNSHNEIYKNPEMNSNGFHIRRK